MYMSRMQYSLNEEKRPNINIYIILRYWTHSSSACSRNKWLRQADLLLWQIENIGILAGFLVVIAYLLQFLFLTSVQTVVYNSG